MRDSDRVYATDSELLDALGAILADMVDVDVSIMQRRTGGSALAKGMPKSTHPKPHLRAAAAKHALVELAGWLEVERRAIADWIGGNGGTVQTMWTRIGPVPDWTADFRRLVIQAGRQLGDAAHPRHREGERRARIAQHVETARRNRERREADDGAERRQS